MKNITVLGAGYVGLVTGASFADLGNKVIVLDIIEEKIKKLQRGDVPIYEPGLSEMILRNVEKKRLSFTTSYAEALKDAEFVFVAVGTPSGVDGEADLRYVRMAAESIAEHMDHPLIIINKSTVPVGTGDWVADIIKKKQKKPIPFWVVSNPEFLREGSAIADFMNPDRVVLGSQHPEAAQKVAELHRPLNAPILITDLRTAEMIKYASNAFLATRISFINEIATICEELGADVNMVAKGMGYDKRIGPHFLNAGLGFGGSCFPKDVRALEHMALIHGAHPQLLRAVLDINQHMRRQAVVKLRNALDGLADKRIGMLGLAFKPNTDDLREAPSLDIARQIIREGGEVQAYDPVARPEKCEQVPELQLVDDAYEAARDADALILVTEWNEFRQLDMLRIRELMRGDVLLDGRNIWSPEKMREYGFRYFGVGRGTKRNGW
ncbi:MAG TPA: UDP-glucose/GDP-mannose dehydrogenase family protein [Anaerolineae bacterium]|nr:UDP-glucose/GDP-mannose dehydrogenase family protein [Anaerolineae bacterium]